MVSANSEVPMLALLFAVSFTANASEIDLGGAAQADFALRQHRPYLYPVVTQDQLGMAINFRW